jgi:hypothetical protein
MNIRGINMMNKSKEIKISIEVEQHLGGPGMPE